MRVRALALCALAGSALGIPAVHERKWKFLYPHKYATPHPFSLSKGTYFLIHFQRLFDGAEHPCPLNGGTKCFQRCKEHFPFSRVLLLAFQMSPVLSQAVVQPHPWPNLIPPGTDFSPPHLPPCSSHFFSTLEAASKSVLSHLQLVFSLFQYSLTCRNISSSALPPQLLGFVFLSLSSSVQKGEGAECRSEYMWRGEDRFRNLSHEILSLLPVPNNNQELAHQQGKETGQIHSTSPSQFWDQ